jgi:mono/diheme cytochrome c family protein
MAHPSPFRSRTLLSSAARRGPALVLSAACVLALGAASRPALRARAVTPAARVAAINASVAAGALDYITFGCENCHGLSGRGGVRVPNISGNAAIPALNTKAARANLNAASLRYIIQHGVVLKSNTARVYMPVWGTVLSTQQVTDLVAYLRAGLPAIRGIAPQPVRNDLGLRVEGQELYIRYGCVVCHAMNGFGGVPNPSSPDKTIPPLRGPDFDKQFAQDSAIAYVIKHGSIIGQAPIASMPVWSGLLSDQQIKALVAYIRSFR